MMFMYRFVNKSFINKNGKHLTFWTIIKCVKIGIE